MRSMYRFSMIAVAVGALALCVAGTAFAEVAIKGSMNAALEMVSSDPTGTSSSSQLGIQSEAVLDFSASSGPVSMKFRIEANDNKTTLDNVRNSIKWQVTDAFSMNFSGMSFGETATVTPFGASTVGQFTPSGSAAGHRASVTQYVFGVNKPSADFRFAFGSSNAGLVLNPMYALDGDGGAASETKTISPYYNGQFGAIGVHFMHSIASGKAGTGQTVDPEASETSVAVIFKGSGFSAVLQIAPGSYTNGADGAEHDTQAINLGVKAAGIAFHYVTESDEVSGATTKAEDNTDIAISYSGAISEGASWTVAYAMSDGLGGSGITAQDGSVSVLSFGLGLKY